MIEIKKILLPTDFSEPIEDVFLYAASLARSYGATIDLIHVVHDIGDMTGIYMQGVSYDDLENEMESVAKNNMELFCKEHMTDDMSLELHTCRGIPHNEIIKAADELDSDIIVMGTHGRRGVDHLLFGSVAEKVVRKSPIPVMTVRGKKLKS